MAFGKFKQLGDLNKMRQQAKQLQRELEKEISVYEKGDVRVKVNGAQELLYLEIDGENRKDVVEVVNKAMKKMQKRVAKKMLEMGGGLSGLLGK